MQPETATAERDAQMLRAFATFDQIATPELFDAIFGTSGGPHLWGVFTGKGECDVRRFITYLDLANGRKFARYFAQEAAGRVADLARLGPISAAL